MGPAAAFWVLSALFHDVHLQCTLQLGHDADEVAKQVQGNLKPTLKLPTGKYQALSLASSLSPSNADVQVFVPPRKAHNVESYTQLLNR